MLIRLYVLLIVPIVGGDPRLLPHIKMYNIACYFNLTTVSSHLPYFNKVPNIYFNCCFTVHFDKYKLFCQQMHLLLKLKVLQFIFKISFLIWLLHVSVPSDHHQGAYDGTLLKLVSLKSLVKTHR